MTPDAVGAGDLAGWGAAAATAPSAVIHPVYLPFTSERLMAHFADTSLGGPGPQHLQHYQASSRRALKHEARVHAGHGLPSGRQCDDLDHQVEKDERFWVVSALMSIFHDRNRVGALTALLTEALGDRPPVEGLATWAEALGDPEQLRLFFEVNLSAPRAHKRYLRDHLRDHVLLPWLREAASGSSLEGATKVDAMLIAPKTGFAVMFEAKVLSDASTHTRYDATRNQIARTVDVLMDRQDDLQPPLNQRRPERTCLVLLTPQVFMDRPSTRLYGWLMDSYRRDTSLLAEHLPHRGVDRLAVIPPRLGWTTWEKCERIKPRACAWLSSALDDDQEASTRDPGPAENAVKN